MRQLALAPRCLQAYGHGRVKMTDIMRGYFGVGVEGVSKPFNIGNLMRSAHAFGAGFVFTIAAEYAGAGSDTAKTHEHVPFYQFDSVAGLTLPKGCALVGIELMDEAVELPSFPHPLNAAYVLGPERGLEMAESWPDVEALLFSEDGGQLQSWATSGVQAPPSCTQVLCMRNGVLQVVDQPAPRHR